MRKVLLPVTDRDESLAHFEALRGQVSSGATAFPNRPVGFRGGGYDCIVYWRPPGTPLGPGRALPPPRAILDPLGHSASQRSLA